MNTLIKALIGTFIVIIGLIGLPILIGLLGVMWPIILVIAGIIFIPVAVGIFIGRKSDD